jgi:hypothetical protein
MEFFENISKIFREKPMTKEVGVGCVSMFAPKGFQN